jgi:hypothetical protein
VATVFQGPLPAGPCTLSWDGRAADGSPVGPGLYFAQLTSAGHGSAVRRVTRLD